VKPRLLDLFCGAGGAAMGYHRAGFDVVGVDISPQPRYPFEFHQGDASMALTAMCHGEFGPISAIHASPVCLGWARVTAWRGDRSRYPDQIAATRARLQVTGLPWVIENVSEAPLRPDLILCGSQFGLAVRRHRVFETSWRAYDLMPSCDHRRLRPFMHKDERAYADAMGCTWMNKTEARQAIPPAYTDYVGRHLLDVLGRAA
jgi:DNA (cytosine-5)-methyltransferase 1